MFEACLERCDIDDADEEGTRVIHYAATSQNVEFINACINHGADYNEPDLSGSTPLHIAAKSGSLPVVKLLCEKEDVDVNAIDEGGFTPLHCAVFAMNSEEIVRALFESGRLEPNITAIELQATPLMISAKRYDMDTIKVFLEHDGIDV